MPRKYLELVQDSFTQEHFDKQAIENKPYVACSVKDRKVIYTVIPEPEQPSLYEAVDLGLPSGLKWANMNVGATSPEDYGMYFQWGDTVGYTKEQIESKDKSFDNTTYWDPEYSVYREYDIIDSNRDIVTAIIGEKWKIPSKSDISELIRETTPTFIDISGNRFSEAKGNISKDKLKGVELTGKNGNSIFIPAAGYYNEYTSKYQNSVGLLWSSEVGPGNNMGFSFQVRY